MSAGTITLTNNSATVTGSGTAFTTDLKVGDFVTATVGGTLYSLIVSAIASNTSLTLNLVYTGPTTGSLAWAAVPAQTLAAITAQIVVESTKALRGLNFDKANWQAIFSGTGNVTVTLPDLTSWTGPAWNSITTQLAGKAAKGANSDITSITGLTTALSVAQGGTGGKTQGDARTGLGLGSAATFNAGDDQGQVLVNRAAIRGGGFVVPRTIGELPPGVDVSSAIWDGWLSGVANGASNNGAPTAAVNGTGYSYVLSAAFTSNNRSLLFLPYGLAGNSGSLSWRSYFGSSWGPFVSTRDTRNTTVDANGFIKQASPIMRLSDNPDEMNMDFMDGFEISGFAAVNFEALGAKAQKVGTGKYRITGSLGFAKEGWTIEIPQDINKNLLCFVEAKESNSGAISINVFKRRFDVASAMIVAGDPMDIPAGRWIDLRLQMPADSIWNARTAAPDTQQQEQQAQQTGKGTADADTQTD